MMGGQKGSESGMQGMRGMRGMMKMMDQCSKMEGRCQTEKSGENTEDQKK